MKKLATAEEAKQTIDEDLRVATVHGANEAAAKDKDLGTMRKRCSDLEASLNDLQLKTIEGQAALRKRRRKLKDPIPSKEELDAPGSNDEVFEALRQSSVPWGLDDLDKLAEKKLPGATYDIKGPTRLKLMA